MKSNDRNEVNAMGFRDRMIDQGYGRGQGGETGGWWRQIGGKFWWESRGRRAKHANSIARRSRETHETLVRRPHTQNHVYWVAPARVTCDIREVPWHTLPISHATRESVAELVRLPQTDRTDAQYVSKGNVIITGRWDAGRVT